MQSGLTAAQLLDLPFYHPTLEEGLKPAPPEICRKAGHQLDRDDTTLAGA
jgi:dihydrolipoamide dehydrogenase